jgi:chemotaxis protein histidine kinase CheA
MTIIQSLITSLEKNNNNKLIEKLEILEKFVSSEESNKLSTEALNKLISDRVKSNNEQEGIKNAKNDTKEEDNNKLSKSVEKEVIEESETKKSEDIMSKFKWVLIGIGIFVLLIFISSIIYWYMNMSSTPSEVPILQPVVTPTDTISQPYHEQNNVPSENQEYSYIPEIFQRNSRKSEELRLSEEGRPQNELRSSRENVREDEIVQEKVKEDERVQEKVNEKEEDERVQKKVNGRVQENERVQEKEENERVQEKEEDERVQEKEEDERVQEKVNEIVQEKEVQEERRSQKEKMFQQEKEDIVKNKGYKLSSKSNFPL